MWSFVSGFCSITFKAQPGLSFAVLICNNMNVEAVLTETSQRGTQLPWGRVSFARCPCPVSLTGVGSSLSVSVETVSELLA